MPLTKKFDYNMIVIGGGSAGLVTAYIAALLNAKVLLIEKHKMGGDCLNTGCVPSKALIRSAKIAGMNLKAKKFGFKSIQTDFDFSDIMERVQSIIKKIEPHDSMERYRSLGVECIQGEAYIKDKHHIKVLDKVYSTKNIVIATGASPRGLCIPGLEQDSILTSENFWDLREQPKKLLVLGSGPIGAELSQSMNRLGSKVTVLEKNPSGHILGAEDTKTSDIIREQMKSEGVNFVFGFDDLTVIKNTQLNLPNEYIAQMTKDGKTQEVEFNKLFLSVGRVPNTRGFGLENLVNKKANPNNDETKATAIKSITNKNGTIKTNPYLQVSGHSNVFACGDVAGPFQLTHTAAHQAWYVAVNALFRPIRFKVDYSVIPWATYTDPEIATVGYTEKKAKQEKINYEVIHYELEHSDRALADGSESGLVQVLTNKKGKILGATIVAPNASDLIMEYTLAMKNKLSLSKIMGTVHPYPSMSEVNKSTASLWKQNHKPDKLLNLLKPYHGWRR